MKKLILFLILGLYLVSFISATCTVTLDQETYVDGEIATATMVCSGAEEKSDAYTLTWTNTTGTIVETDTGTTPATANEFFFESYEIPSNYNSVYGDNLTATLTGPQQEGSDWGNISAVGSSNLILSDFSITSDYFIEKEGGIKFLASMGGNPVANARCILDIVDGNGLPISEGINNQLATQGNGYIITSAMIKDTWAEEGKQYRWDISCTCYDSDNTASDGQMGHCYDGTTGLPIAEFAFGSTQYSFTVTDIADKMVVNKWETEDTVPGIWLVNEFFSKTNMTNTTTYQAQDEINWSSYNQTDTTHNRSENGKAFLTAGDLAKACFLVNNTFDSDKTITVHDLVFHDSEDYDFFYPVDVESELQVKGKEQPILHEIISANTQEEVCTEFFLLPYEVVGSNTWSIGFDYEVDGYEQEITPESDKFTIFGKEKDERYVGLIDITNVTTDKYNQNVSSLSDIEITWTYDYWGDPEQSFVAEYCFEQTNDDIMQKCVTKPINPDKGSNKQIKDTAVLPFFENDGEGEVTVIIYKDHRALGTGVGKVYGYGDTEPQNTFEIKNFNITNLTTSAYGGNVTACEPINITMTYDFWGSEEGYDQDYLAKVCFENTDDDAIAKCYEEQLDLDVGADNTIFLTEDVPYFANSGNAEVEILIYKEGILVEDGDTEPYNTFTIVADNSDSCKYSENYDQVINLRQAEALEGIENKTGTFHLDVNCPSTGRIGSDMSCDITAYVEDSQIVEKEVDFTCHISDGTSTYSSVNFNQMVTRLPTTNSRTFSVPSSFSDGNSYVLQCYADYYNLGSRRDSFYDTFIASTTSGGGGSSGGGSIGNESGGAPITGGAIDEGEGDKPRLSPEDFNPFSPNRNWAFMFVELIILIGLIVLVYSLIKKKHKKHSYHSSNKSKFLEVMKKILAIIFILAVLSLLIFGVWYGYKNVKSSFSEKTGIEQDIVLETAETSQILLQGDLTQSIFLIFIAILIMSLIIILFTAILLWILSKLLNIRGEIKFGHDSSTRRYYEDRKSAKLQQKLNQIMLKNEIKRETTKEDYKVRKMTQKEFADFIKRKNEH